MLTAGNLQTSRLHHIITEVLDRGGATDEVNCFKPQKSLIVSQALPHLFQMPLVCLFSDLNKKECGLIEFIQLSKSKYQHVYALNEQVKHT